MAPTSSKPPMACAVSASSYAICKWVSLDTTKAILRGRGMKNRSVSQDDFLNGDKMYMTRTTNTRIVGFGLFTGFNVFIAELPISVGLEYGLTGKWIFGGKTKVEMEQTIDAFDFDESSEWYEQEEDAFGNDDLNLNGLDQQYSELSRRQFLVNTNHNVRLNIHIYFGTRTDMR